MRGERRLAVAFLAWTLLVAGAPRIVSAHEPLPARRQTAPAQPLASNPSLAIIRTAPDFTLLDLDGRPARLADWRGRVVLVSFIYTSCPSACPLVTQRMAALQRRLIEARLLPSRVGLVSVTVDPGRDSAEALARYANAFGADPEGWRFLRESPERLRPVLAAYDEWTRFLPGGELDHPARLHLVDARARIREIYSLALFDERQAFLDIQALLREPR